MGIKTLIIIGLFVALSGCMGTVAEKELSKKTQSDSGHSNKSMTNSKTHDMSVENGLTNERRIASMMSWIKLSTD